MPGGGAGCLGAVGAVVTTLERPRLDDARRGGAPRAALARGRRTAAGGVDIALGAAGRADFGDTAADGDWQLAGCTGGRRRPGSRPRPLAGPPGARDARERGPPRNYTYALV